MSDDDARVKWHEADGRDLGDFLIRIGYSEDYQYHIWDHLPRGIREAWKRKQEGK
jgi:hypothetical protein